MDRVRRPKMVSDYQPLGLDHDQAKALLATAVAAGPRDHALVCLLLLNGLRVTEACSTAIADLGEARGHATLRIERKGGAESTVPLAPRTAEAVRLAVAERTSGPILLDWEGRPLDRYDAARVCRRLGRAAGIGPVYPHALRHAFVTLSLDGGAALRDVQDAAGHADPRTTRRYDRSRHNLDRHPTYALSGFLDAIEDPT
jgi:integrase